MSPSEAALATRPEAGRSSLILTLTRACNLRCSYCPTAKDGWPSLSSEDVEKAVHLFAENWGGGDVKLFGGEPLLLPELAAAAIDAAARRPEIRRVYLSTNGLGLTSEWFERLRAEPKMILTISMDGRPEDHRRFRRADRDEVPDSYDHLMTLLPLVTGTPRVVITQTIAPATARRAAENFRHLMGLGIRRFNLLPGYYLPWKAEQLTALRQSFREIAVEIRNAWADGERLYLRNLFTWAPTPFFNTGLVVDADGLIHPTNLGLSGALDHLRKNTHLGSLDEPPTPEALARRASEVNDLLASELAPGVWQSTLAADAELSRLCRGLYPAWMQQRRARGAA